jgi:hypothetical protein
VLEAFLELGGMELTAIPIALIVHPTELNDQRINQSEARRVGKAGEGGREGGRANSSSGNGSTNGSTNSSTVESFAMSFWEMSARVIL